MTDQVPEFSFRSRERALERLRNETFDLLIIGGGITGAAVARDATSRGLSVALVEKRDFAFGTSSRSSKLVHGGLRYLENFEFKLVFEALSERTLLLKTAPHMVRPLKFFWPVYREDRLGRGMLAAGLWLYDLLSLFRTPGIHRQLSKRKLLGKIPFLRADGLKGGFEYYDASMWDDVMTVEELRDSAGRGAAIANYVEAVSPIWTGDRITGFNVRESAPPGDEFEVRARRVVICAGPWLDQLGETLAPKWRHWLTPSKGVHLIFDLKRIPIPGAMVMSHPADGRISFVIPRTDFGSGVVVVGTTDGPTPADPARATVESGDVKYLLELLNSYFPELKLTASDILSAYVGVRPLMGPVPAPGAIDGTDDESKTGEPSGAPVLQKVSREHHIDLGPGGTTLVAGGKYTTHRKMAEEIVDYTIRAWKKDAEAGKSESPPQKIGRSATEAPMNPQATPAEMDRARMIARRQGIALPEELLTRYGASALDILQIADRHPSVGPDPEGFPHLEAQLRFSIRHEMTYRLEDFYLRRLPLFAARGDHGLPWADRLSRVWAEELGRDEGSRAAELEALLAEVRHREEWKHRL